MKREANAQSILTKYVEAMNKKGIYFYYELKQTTKQTYDFSFEEQQLSSLSALQRKGTAYKWSDQDQRQKPCDGASLPPLQSYVIIKYPKCFCIIGLDVFQRYALESGKKSLPLTIAKEIAERILTR